MKKTFEICEMTLGDIVLYEEDNVREIDAKLVQSYSDDMQGYGINQWQLHWGQRMSVVQVDGDYVLYSGFHTYRAAQLSFGITHEVAVNVYLGDKDVCTEHMQAGLLSCGENAKHGKRRDKSERREAIDRWLLCKICDDSSSWSDRYIGKMCAVSAGLVKIRRDELVQDGHPVELVKPDIRYGVRDREKYITSKSVSSAQESKPVVQLKSRNQYFVYAINAGTTDTDGFPCIIFGRTSTNSFAARYKAYNDGSAFHPRLLGAIPCDNEIHVEDEEGRVLLRTRNDSTFGKPKSEIRRATSEVKAFIAREMQSGDSFLGMSAREFVKKHAS